MDYSLLSGTNFKLYPSAAGKRPRWVEMRFCQVVCPRVNNLLTEFRQALYSATLQRIPCIMNRHHSATVALFETSKAAGFTLVELLAVIAVIGILAGLFLPALSRAKAKAVGIACLNNQRQLALACQLYVDEFGDALPYNLGEADTRRTVAEGRNLNWVNNVMNWELEMYNTNAALIAAGGLGPYCAGRPEVFRCPSDKVLSDLQRRAGWRERLRSVSMNAMVGNAGSFMREGYNVNNPDYRQFSRLAEIAEPVRIFVFIEEHPDSINDGYFLNRPSEREWIDLPATYHNGAANLTFADGHAEFRRWVDRSTERPAQPDGAGLPFKVDAGGGADFDWLMERTTLRTGGSYRAAYGAEP